MKFLKIVGHVIGIICTALILPSFISTVTDSLLMLEPARFIQFFMYPMVTGAMAAKSAGNVVGYLNMAIGYAMYIIAAIYVIYLLRKIISWYRKAKLYDQKNKTCG
ncbi:hypothetical protein [Listeria sp. PSOL-1]|uniref:hypothetical protein n=1 Tax=Listeria sp. PSOL-1 TaxID=1844999 RepID=UPI0013D7D1B9|nr:hypothetical protein [Listeria sp. PSOL-1]